MLTRRTFAKALVSVGTGLLASTDTWPAEKPPDPQDRISQQNCDFLIKGGTVIDPGQHLHAPLDVAVKDGKSSRYPTIFLRVGLLRFFPLRARS